MTAVLGFPTGRLNGERTPVGTILGPDGFGEWLVVVAVDDAGVMVSRANAGNISEALAAIEVDGPRSLAEVRLQRSHQISGAQR